MRRSPRSCASSSRTCPSCASRPAADLKSARRRAPRLRPSSAGGRATSFAEGVRRYVTGWPAQRLAVATAAEHRRQRRHGPDARSPARCRVGVVQQHDVPGPRRGSRERAISTASLALPVAAPARPEQRRQPRSRARRRPASAEHAVGRPVARRAARWPRRSRRRAGRSSRRARGAGGGAACGGSRACRSRGLGGDPAASDGQRSTCSPTR